MKITSIKQQIKRAGRYSIYIEGEYVFSLSEDALLASRLVKGQELSSKEVAAYKKLSSEDKLYYQALRYAALRPHTRWEIATYLERKEASPPLVDIILNKLSIIDLVNDEKYAQAFVNDRRLLRPTSRRKIISELRRKHIDSDIITRTVGDEGEDEVTALQAIAERKRKQTKYQDDLKLMQYLARQGFGYSDIKAALQQSATEE